MAESLLATLKAVLLLGESRDVAHRGTHFFAHCGSLNVTVRFHVENDDRKVVVHRQGDSRRIKYLEAPI